MRTSSLLAQKLPAVFRRARRAAGSGRATDIEALEGRTLMAAGFLDPSFDGDGRVASGAAGFASAVVVQPDGKIVTAGEVQGAGGRDFLLVRYNVDGSPDGTFGTNGRVTTTFAGGNDSARGVALQRDGKIVAVGSSGSPQPHFAVARYNPDGTLDATFAPGGDDGDGRLTFTFGGYDESAFDVVVQDDQRIVVAGRAFPVADGPVFALSRLTPDGSLDPTFGGDGRVTTSHGDLGAALGVAMAPGNKIVAVGIAGGQGGRPDSVIVRYNADGSLDDTFGPMPEGQGVPPGVVRNAFDNPVDADWLNDVVVDADGTILVAGFSGARGFAVARFAEDGLFYRKFDVPDLIASDAVSIGLQRDGKVVAAGGTNTARDFAVVRYSPEGSLDPTFGLNGVALTDFRQPRRDGPDAPPTLDALLAAALSPRGEIVAVGTAGPSGGAGDAAVVARYLGDLDATPAPVSVAPGRGMTVTGTDGPDDVRVSPWGADYVVDLNGSLFLGRMAQAPKVFVSAGGGDDLVRAVAASGGAVAVPMDVSGGAGNDTLVGGASNDLLRGDDGNDGIDGGRGADAVLGGAGDDLILASENGPGSTTLGDDYYVGGPGTDTISYAARTHRLVIRLGGTATGGPGERDIVRNDIERVVGGSGNDTIEGNNADNFLLGGPGNDRLLGRGGNDVLLGDVGDDVLTDGAGTNILDGGPGFDTINGVREGPTEVTLEAETATLGGVTVGRSNPGYTGTGYADFNNARGDFVEWAYNAPAAGQYTLTVRYANGGSTDRPLELAVNGTAAVPRLSFAPTGSWSTWRTVTVTVQLAAGANRIRLTSIGSNGANIDNLSIS